MSAALELVAQSDTHPTIARLLDRLYAAISFEEGAEPDWAALRDLFSKHARITRITPEGIDYLSPEAFLDMTHSLFEMGAYTSFYEFELQRRVDQFGNTAQVWSAYETRRNLHAHEALGRGLNSIQLICDGDSWRVLGLLWDETNANPELDVARTFAARTVVARTVVAKDEIGG